RSASEQERQRAHQALADATDPEVDPDRRAWHRAQAAAGPDESVALELEHSAARAQSRGGAAAAAAVLERAVALTAPPPRWFERTLARAEAKQNAGEIEGALRLLAMTDARPLDALARARVTFVRGRMTFLAGNVSDAPRLLVEAAQELDAHDSAMTAPIYLVALAAASAGGTFARDVDLPAVAAAIRARPPSRQRGTASDLVLEGLACFDTDGPAAAAEVLAQAVAAFSAPDLAPQDVPWVALAVATASA